MFILNKRGDEVMNKDNLFLNPFILPQKPKDCGDEISTLILVL